MARATQVYSANEWQLAYVAETTAGTANVTGMSYLNLQSDVTLAWNAFRSAEAKHGVGRTAKAVDSVTITKGQTKELSFTMLMDCADFMAFAENWAGEAADLADGILDVGVAHAPAAVGLGDTDTDNTGCLTFALVPPYAAEAVVIPGCIIKTLTVSADKGTEGGRFVVDVVAATQGEISTGQANPTTPTAYTAPSALGIYDLCNETKYGGVDIQLTSFSLTLENNVKFTGACNEGGWFSAQRGVPEFAVSGNLAMVIDAKSADKWEDAITSAESAISLTDGDNIAITIAKTTVTGDVNVERMDDIAIYNIPFKAIAGTTGELLSIEFGENTA